MRRTFLALTALAAVPLCARAAHAASDAPIAMCSGISGGNYDFTTISIARQLGAKGITNVNTAGSMENLDKVASDACQAGLGQADAWFLYQSSHPQAQLALELARNMYPEYGHLICNASVKEISDLKRGNTVLVGNPGSGSAVMWEAIVRANKAYADVATLPIGGIRALGKVADGTDAQCMLFVAGLKSPVMNEANDFAKTAPGLHLTYMRDPALFAIKDGKGRAIYARSAIPDGTYPNGLQKGGWISSGKPVDTVEVQSVLFANTSYIDANGPAYETFLKAVKNALPAINDRVLPH